MKIFIIVWLLFGLLAVIIGLFCDFRDTNIDYVKGMLDGEYVFDMFFTLLLGIISIINILVDNNIIAKAIYRITNIGLKNKDE